MFPVLSRQAMLAITEKQLGSFSIVTMKPNGSGRTVIFDTENKGLDPMLIKKGLAGAFQPNWSPDGQRIVFTRKVKATNVDIRSIRPDDSALTKLTTSPANDGHAVWTHDNRILWSSGERGFRDEAALHDNTFQPYGQIFLMDADGGSKEWLTDSQWEDSMPLFVPNHLL